MSSDNKKAMNEVLARMRSILAVRNQFIANLNPTPRSPNGTNRRPNPKAHRNPADRADPSAGGTAANFSISLPTYAAAFFPEPTPIPYAGVRAGEITGYRLWLVIDGYLSSIAHYQIWEPGTVMEGDINKIVLDTPLYPPIYGGVYAYREIDKAENELPAYIVEWPKSIDLGGHTKYKYYIVTGLVLGRVKLWGEVVEHTLGYRAQYAKITHLDHLIGIGDLDLLRKTYNV